MMTCCLVAISLMGFIPAAGEDGTITADRSLAPVRFASDEIRAALAVKREEISKRSPMLRIVIEAGAAPSNRRATALGVAPPKFRSAQSYAIRKVERDGQTTLAVLAEGPIGAMYGGLDLAEQIRIGPIDTIASSDHAPRIERRGIKFNVPLDARTPSYSDNSTAAQANIPEVWSIEFWGTFLDDMARHRYNVLSLWSLHPFPSMVKVPEYPDVALDDVMRTTLPLDETFSHSGSDMVRPAMLEKLEVVKKLSIDDKIAFWRQVMEMARDRGVDVYLFTWNVFTFGATGKHGITPSMDNPATIAYFRASVRETVKTYPLLAGMGITAGEQMKTDGGPAAKEKWLWDTYGEGIRDALGPNPDRSFRLIHRFHMTDQGEILRAWKDYPGPFDFSFKYAIAHMYSVPEPPFLRPVLAKLAPGLKTWLTIRNDDIYSFRWADPSFARAFVKAIPGPDRVAGFYMGPDGIIWGRETSSTEPESPPETIISKQWLSFLLWGRLSYEPDLSDERIESIVAARFPQVPGPKLLATWSEASKVFPQITRFFWGDIDLKWFPEASLSHPRHRGFYTVRHFVEGRTMPESGILDVLTYRDRVLRKKTIEFITPPQVADTLERHARNALKGLAAIRGSLHGEPTKELRLTLGDIEAMAHLGLHYAEKVRAATDLALFDATRDEKTRQTAIRHAESALAHWKNYAKVYASQYRPQLLNRVGFVDIPALTEKVAADVAIIRDWAPGTIDAAKLKRDGQDVPFRP
jgi:hypothetical protein